MEHSISSTIGKTKMDFLKLAVVALLLPITSGCGSTAKDYSGRWKPINRYQSAAAAIPLNPQYLYYATPMDGTLRTMLRRWAKDSGKQFAYHLQTDYTLSQPVAAIRTTDIQQALDQLNAIYGSYGIRLSAEGGQLIATTASDINTPSSKPPAAG
ncbi:hypothetical protein [Dyella silvae]|uniref:hypothetical protein n=1 Tax=Dyella silvae TaxID=2994424 RepID=UPI002264109C|nr:hypothetical protein [Dyella silvae]